LDYITNKYVHKFSYPSKQIPGWSSLVDRWYQLDAPSFGLADIYWNYKNTLTNKPGMIILASDEGSLEIDLQFIKSFSPSKFVYTLPNVRSSALCQVTSWHCPILCIQQTPKSLESAVAEAMTWACKEYQKVWICDVKNSGESNYLVQLIELNYKELNE